MVEKQIQPYFSFIIPNWNGERFIAKCLSSLILAAMSTKLPYEGIVVDDASTDRSVDIIKEKFPEIKIIINLKNQGFAKSVNIGVSSAASPLVVLINNDIIVTNDFFAEILKPFEMEGKGTAFKNNDEKLFAVSAKTVNWESGEPNHLNMTAHFKSGEIVLDYEDSKETKKTFFVQGGAGAFRRDLFIELGGLSSIYHPGYWEDYDISYLSMKCGYYNLYVPSCIAHHYGKGTFLSLLGKDGLNILVERNHFLFTWLNLTDFSFIISHFLYLPYNISKSIIRGKNISKLKAFIKAVLLLPKVLKMRRTRLKKYKFLKNDKSILSS